MSELTPRKERERVFRRNEIQQAASKLFAVKGFNSTTLEEIAEAAEFGKGTIYNYFQNKEEIYLSIISDVLENIGNILEESDAKGETFEIFVKEYIGNIFKYCVENKFSYLIFVREIAHFDPLLKKENNSCLTDYHSLSQKIMNRRFKTAVQNFELKKYDVQKIINFFIHVVFPYIHYLLLCNPLDKILVEEEKEIIADFLLNGILLKKQLSN
ncbi:MAG: TetR/AcrR family transcriptional regulator [Ignavibacteriaceae bacterium]|nr:TetR/AcrR family transcriptional regulator [Ignavibacteriaceae bacterium]